MKNHIKAWIDFSGMNQAEVSRETGISAQEISKYSSNKVQPRKRNREKIANLLGITLKELANCPPASHLSIIPSREPETPEELEKIRNLFDEEPEYVPSLQIMQYRSINELRVRIIDLVAKIATSDNGHDNLEKVHEYMKGFCDGSICRSSGENLG